ncbi:unnamed protein product [Orchesella dallaii]|uniref:Metalloendopeptidase n=1 Tax=Orchesella dallaii TaxID=48710 RepID=A0ABP1PSL3_9HEXA
MSELLGIPQPVPPKKMQKSIESDERFNAAVKDLVDSNLLHRNPQTDPNFLIDVREIFKKWDAEARNKKKSVERRSVDSNEDQEETTDEDEDDDNPNKELAQAELEEDTDSQVEYQNGRGLETDSENSGSDMMPMPAQTQPEVEVEEVSNRGENNEKTNEEMKAEVYKEEMPAGAESPMEEEPDFVEKNNNKPEEDSEPPLSNRVLDPRIDNPPESNLEEDSSLEPENQRGIPLVYGAATMVRPIPYHERNQDVGGSYNQDDEAGFINDDEDSLKDSVITSVLEAEIIADGFDCSGNRGHLRHMTSNSKYFVDVARLYNFREAREVCSKLNLVIAEVEGLGDHRTIEEFMSVNEFYDAKGSSGGGSFFIGLNDIKIEGVFKHGNGKNVTYQNFLPSQPDDKHETEDCVTITKETRDGPAGSADFDCNKTAHVFCMFRADTQCYNESKETIENRKLETERNLHLLVNATERAYFVSNYQATWKEAMKQCEAKQMKVFNMDGVVTMGFFRSILKWERNFFRVRMPTVQYWTSGKFQKSHMTAPIIWHTKPELNESEERGVEKHNSTFSFSGLYHWSTAKKRDPGGPHGWRRDLCVSFGFDKNPEAIPYLRNTNCDLPTYFVCYVEYPEISGEEEGTDTDTTSTDGPRDPQDMPVLLEDLEPDEEDDGLEEASANETMPVKTAYCTTNAKEDSVEGRNGIQGNKYRWWSGFTVYIDPSYSRYDRRQMNLALDKLRKALCIPFYLFRRNQRPYGDYVHIRNLGDGRCHSLIGKYGGAQTMSLGRGCTDIGSALHEMGHALGLYHEHSRPDRDKYITIYWRNINQNLRSQFEIERGTNSYGVPYNTRSIMHYPGDAFSGNGRATMASKTGGRLGGDDLQQTDINLLRKMYRCDE